MKHFDALTQRGQIGRLYAAARQALTCYGLTASRLQLLQNEKGAVLKVRTTASGQSPGTFVLRIYRTEPPGGIAAIRSQAGWLRAILEETDVVVPGPVANLQGDYVTTLSTPMLDGVVHCSLMRWVAGKPRLLRTGPGVEALQQVGRMMAKLHLHGQQYEAGPDGAFTRYDYEGLFGESSCYWPRDGLDAADADTLQLFERAMQRIRQVMDQLGCGPDVFGLIHGDLIQVNYIFCRGQVRAIDFGDCGYGYYLYDMGVTLLMLYAFDADGSQRAAFLDGYREVRPLSEEHERLLDVFITGRAVALCRWFMGNENLRKSGGMGWANSAVKWVRQWLGHSPNGI